MLTNCQCVHVAYRNFKEPSRPSNIPDGSVCRSSFLLMRLWVCGGAAKQAEDGLRTVLVEFRVAQIECAAIDCNNSSRESIYVGKERCCPVTCRLPPPRTQSSVKRHCAPPDESTNRLAFSSPQSENSL